MDIYCPVCGEPWAIDELHEVPDKHFALAQRRFRSEGCAVFGSRHNDPADRGRAATAAVLFDLLGDDIDGIASLMDE